MADNPKPGQPDEFLPSYHGVQRVDPAVRLGKLEGPINGEVAMEVTIGKPQAYKPNRYDKGMGNE